MLLPEKSTAEEKKKRRRKINTFLVPRSKSEMFILAMRTTNALTKTFYKSLFARTRQRPDAVAEARSSLLMRGRNAQKPPLSHPHHRPTIVGVHVRCRRWFGR